MRSSSRSSSERERRRFCCGDVTMLSALAGRCCRLAAAVGGLGVGTSHQESKALFGSFGWARARVTF
jgi:hypothetical protein